MADDNASVISTSTSATTTRKSDSKQVLKLKDANTKYKNLLKLAKERIQAQEEEIAQLQKEKEEQEQLQQSQQLQQKTNSNGSLSEYNSQDNNDANSIVSSFQYDLPRNGVLAVTSGNGNCQWSIVRVCQLIRVEHVDADDQPQSSIDGPQFSIGSDQMEEGYSNNASGNDDDVKCDIWALIEYKISSMSENTTSTLEDKKFQRWRRFASESALSDHIRRETGEPVLLPPYSLSPEQSAQVEEEARQAVSHVTEEFRRYRVRAEVARKQADATVKALHHNQIKTTQERIEGQDLETEILQARTDHALLENLRAEMSEQEAHWKQAYDTLLAENSALKSSGAEALLAAQWRQRYEVILKEKETLETNLQMELEKSAEKDAIQKKEDAGKFEAKYRDLKESFRLYRKKAKEIFEAQQRGDVAVSFVNFYHCFSILTFDELSQ